MMKKNAHTHTHNLYISRSGWWNCGKNKRGKIMQPPLRSSVLPFRSVIRTISGVFLICFVFCFAHKMSVRHFIFSTQSFQLGNRCFALSSLLRKVATNEVLCPMVIKMVVMTASVATNSHILHRIHSIYCVWVCTVVHAPPNFAIEIREMYAIRSLSLCITQIIELKTKRIACHIHIENPSQYTKQLINYANEFLWPSASCLVHTVTSSIYTL